ncbi:MmcQ/YjbR family DNA-binding protein [Herbiconiux sp. CPCC 205716]|uniref:MmcQ/YjbR family DNA-binding protein n=1 Tax=Herbiconiux gentiana TaxID=2970912 RepID=A0ABT2GL41_9MICO|nr:MmcQ/YjbR family DNA-binding protein [Herbiconiux gentiana]MCS5716312.1 MmcQ/YjbR family DNA-binding protein [Herbiconiux gentiana]
MEIRRRADVLEACAALPATTDERPFGPETAVAKVVGKVFALTPLDSEVESVTLKVAPAHGEALVRDHPWIRPGYHMNKRHWVTVTLGPGSDGELVHDLIVNSYDLVVAGLPRAQRP